MRMTAMLGYARVSTIGQDLDAQLAALDAAGVDPSRAFTDKLSGSAKRPGRDWSRCSTMPGPETAWSLPRSTGSADPSPRSPAPSPISVNGESRCMSYAKASIRPRQQGELSRPSWPASPNWSSNWAASARRIPRIPSRPASAATKPPKLSPERQEQLRRLAVTGEPVHQLA
jgi:hypothetical protein